jgi:hypothetical protein
MFFMPLSLLGNCLKNGNKKGKEVKGRPFQWGHEWCVTIFCFWQSFNSMRKENLKNLGSEFSAKNSTLLKNQNRRKKKKTLGLVQESVRWRPQMGKCGPSEGRPKPLDTRACWDPMTGEGKTRGRKGGLRRSRQSLTLGRPVKKGWPGTILGLTQNFCSSFVN